MDDFRRRFRAGLVARVAVLKCFGISRSLKCVFKNKQPIKDSRFAGADANKLTVIKCE